MKPLLAYDGLGDLGKHLRQHFPKRLERMLIGPADAVRLPRQYRLLRWVFVRALGVTFFCAFASLWVQYEGLLGSDGILPAADYLDTMASRLESVGVGKWWRVPTVFWLSASDGMLLFAALLGLCATALLIAGVLPGAMLLLAWLLYLSFVNVGQVFFAYQWDALLLEAAFVALFFVPWSVRPKSEAKYAVSLGGLWLVRLLLFKLLFLSGVVKLLSGDPTWRDLTALHYHYWTQPLPTWTSYLMNALPHWLHAASQLGMLAVELGLVWFIFGSRRMQVWAFVGFVSLQVGILLTGNYGFFNILTLCLCLCLLDDQRLQPWVPESIRAWFQHPPVPRPAWLRRCQSALVALVMVLSLGQVWQRGWGELSWLQPAYGAVRGFHSVNSYGLFAMMTTRRPEILVEGSVDGRNFSAYHFKYKPGPLTRRPEFMVPHMPRLDWQMWFAALGTCSHNGWLHSFAAKLLQGSPAVRDLLADDPFPRGVPKFIRTTVFNYEFSNEAHEWWRSRMHGPYCPPLMLHNGRLTDATPMLRRSLESRSR